MKVGVIGAGYWGRKHVDEYSHIPGADLAWVADLSPESRKFCQENYDVPNVTADHRELLNSDVEAISICVANDLHFDVAREALQAGKHVLVEKPLTMTTQTSRQLVDLAAEQDLTLAVGHIYRFNNAILKLRELAKDRYFGEVFGIISRWTTLCDPFPGRDVVFDLAPHAFDILNFVLDEWPERITCNGGAYRRKELEEMAFITAEYPSGILGHIEASWLLPGKVRSVEVMGRERSAHVECLSQKMRIHESGYDFDMDVERNNTIRTELEHFLDAVSRGDHATNSGLVGMKTVACLEAAVTAMREKRVVELSWDD